MDEWLPGEVLRRTETQVPNTKVTMKTFDVSYSMRVSPDSDQEQTVNERRVKSDRIRLLANVEGEVEEHTEAVAAQKPAVDENTGETLYYTRE